MEQTSWLKRMDGKISRYISIYIEREKSYVLYNNLCLFKYVHIYVHVLPVIIDKLKINNVQGGRETELSVGITMHICDIDFCLLTGICRLGFTA